MGRPLEPYCLACGISLGAHPRYSREDLTAWVLDTTLCRKVASEVDLSLKARLSAALEKGC